MKLMKRYNDCLDNLMFLEKSSDRGAFLKEISKLRDIAGRITGPLPHEDEYNYYMYMERRMKKKKVRAVS